LAFAIASVDMSLETKLNPFDRDVLFDLSGLSPQEQSAALAEFARQEIAKAVEQNTQAIGHSVEHETFVDGRKNAALESVSPTGTIVAEFDLGTDLVEWIWGQVQKHSPVLTGGFRKSQRLFADGVEVDGPAYIPDGAEEIVITSVAPYARKIERGESKQAPDGVYEAVAAMAATRYGNQARIRFTYREPMGGATELEQWARRHSSREQGAAKRRRQYSKDVRQPAIVITLR
jgi:hypothetical protein